MARRVKTSLYQPMPTDTNKTNFEPIPDLEGFVGHGIANFKKEKYYTVELSMDGFSLST